MDGERRGGVDARWARAAEIIFAQHTHGRRVDRVAAEKSTAERERERATPNAPLSTQ